MNKKKKSSAKVLITRMLVIIILGSLLYYLSVSSNGENDPISSVVTVTDTFDDDLYLYQTDIENIIMDNESGVGFVNNELLLYVNDTVSKENIVEAISLKGAIIVGFNKYLNSYQVQFDKSYSEEELEALRQEFFDMDLFEKVRFNVAFEIHENSIFTPNDSKWKKEWGSSPDGNNWGAEAIRAPEMWGAYDITNLTPVNVGVLDTQFFTEHEDLSFVSTFLNELNDLDDAEDNYYHGTHVSGTIAADFNNGKGIAGIAPRVNLHGASMYGLMDGKVKINNNITLVNIIEAGITYLIVVKECKVVNYSIRLGNEKVADEIVDALLYFIEHYNAEFLIVCTAGNGGNDGIPDDAKNNSAFTRIVNSTIKDRIIVVGATKLLQNGTIKVAEYSNYGSRVDLVAPGSNIYSTVYQKKSWLDATFSHSGYAYKSGTSMAAPHVSGVAAAIWSVNPNLNGSEVKKIICDTASGSYSYEDSAKFPDTYKMLDAYEAIKLAEDYDPIKSQKNDDSWKIEESVQETESKFRGNLSNTGVYNSKGVHEFNELIWKLMTDGPIFSSPVVADGVVYIGSWDGYLYAVDSKTGQEKWKFNTNSWIVSSPAVADGVVYIGSSIGEDWVGAYLYALDSKTGQEKWKFNTDGNGIHSSPAVADGLVYIGCSDGYLYAIDSKTGQEKWKFNTNSWNVYSSPAVADGVVYIGIDDGYLYAVDSKAGQEKWKFKTDNEIFSSPAVADGVVYIGSWDGYLYAIDSKTGQEKWKFDTDYSIDSSPAVADGVVYIGNWDGYLYAVDSKAGQEKWKFKTDDGISSSPAVADGVVYIGSWDGYLYAVDSKTGQEKWKYNTYNWMDSSPTFLVLEGVGFYIELASSPVVADGVVYIGSPDGYLYVIR